MTLFDIITEELSAAMVRRPEGTPAAAKIALHVEMMESDLKRMNITDDDAARVKVALQYCAINIDRWPTAIMVRQHLPKPYTPPQLQGPPPKTIAQTARTLGLELRAGETPAELAARCKAWLESRRGFFKNAVMQNREMAKEIYEPGTDKGPAHTST